MANTWIDELNEGLNKSIIKDKASSCLLKYQDSFSESYKVKNSPENAIDDMINFETLSQKHPISVNLYEKKMPEGNALHFKIYQFNEPTPLSDVLPMLENMNLRTLSEESHEVITSHQLSIWISDYTVTLKSASALDISSVKSIFEEMFLKTFFGECENDGFNSLTLLAGLNAREIIIIRAYAKYIKQTRFRFSQKYIESTLALHPKIAKLLVSFFMLKHNPHNQILDSHEIEKVETEIRNALESVSSLDEDRILRRYWLLINATLRTNYFQTINNGEYKSYIALKLLSDSVPELPLPHPLFDTFVYSTRFEAIHLRGDKVARGGIRWSDRREDFRTEVLGLMKAQKVKNSIIVPSGAKGGFVPKNLPRNGSREDIQKEVIACYQLFISGLLDITDNIKNNKVVKPIAVRCYDGDDTYLVVAADKGTASFSDIANQLSADYQFWLGDAFASGGSAGYDHKKMGITARGAWESIKRHFKEMDIDVMQTPITVVGIGDMSGDVFGNGALYSNHMQLVAAFDHRHIFIDPTPNVEASYNERLRLFNLPTSSWEDFNPSIISTGGGVFKRSLKSITISSEAKKVIGIVDDSLSPNDLIKALLKAPVDLLFNGGIGTYVKGQHEGHDEVSDKANEFCRVNGFELRCKVVGEGGNLGFTQRGRVEFALNGGLINTDFIDNSAGVDCSDHEVNIKILLNKKLANNEITLEDRNKLLNEMTDKVSSLVLSDNYHQALTMSFSSFHSASYIDLYQNHIRKLESFAKLSRAIEFLPDDKQLLERKSHHQGLTRPELAVLLAYTKIHVKAELLKSTILGDLYMNNILSTAFPDTMNEKYSDDLAHHHLRSEIIATQLSNLMINTMGVTFPYRLQSETGSSIAKVAQAFLIAYKIYHSEHLYNQLELFEAKLPIQLSYHLLHIERQLLNMATRWFLRQNRMKAPISQIIAHYEENIAKLEKVIPRLIVGETKIAQQNLIEQCIKAGLSHEVSLRFAISRVMYTALNIIDISTQNKFDLLKTAEVYFGTGGKFNLVWFRDQLAKDSREGLRNNLARLTLRDDLDALQRQLTTLIIQSNPSEPNSERLLNRWAENHSAIVGPWQEVLSSTQENSEEDYTMYFIALRELANLVNFNNYEVRAPGSDINAFVKEVVQG